MKHAIHHINLFLWPVFIFLGAAFTQGQEFVVEKAPEKLTFGSRHDHFVLKLKDSRYHLNNEKVELGVFSNFLPLFQQQFNGSCAGTPEQPDLTVHAHFDGQKTKSRHFYISERQVSDGEHCNPLKGNGLYQLPLHRDWLKQQGVKEGLEFGDNFAVHGLAPSNLHFEKKNGRWRTTDKDVFVDWEFFEKFLASLREYPVTIHLHKAAASNKPAFKLVIGDKTFKFYKTTSGLWALDKPTSKWLVSSEKWTLWHNLSSAQWQSPHAEKLKKIANKNLAQNKRLQALKKLRPNWSRSVKHALQERVLDPDDDEKIRLQSLKLLKQHPSLDNFGVLIEGLDDLTNAQVQQALSRALQIRNPDGPLIRIQASPQKRKQAIKTWKQWWQSARDEQGME